jgi:hypothetical protein
VLCQRVAGEAVHPKLIHFPGRDEQPPMSTFEIILVVGLVCIEGAIGSVAIALDKLRGAVNDPKDGLHKNLQNSGGARRLEGPTEW